MDKDEALQLLNNNLTLSSFDIADSAHKFIIEYLTDKGIELDRINMFIKVLSEHPLFIFGNTLNKCFVHSVKYCITKYGICSVSKDDKTLYYF